MTHFAHDKFDLALLRGELSPPARLPPVLEPVLRAKVASYSTLEQAREAVTVLAEEGVPTRHIRVDGGRHGPTAPFTYRRAVAHGAAAGAWVGLALGFVSGVVKIGAWHEIALGEPALGTTPFFPFALLCALAGALIGSLLGALTHALAGAASGEAEPGAGARAQYDVLVDDRHAEGARSLLLRSER